MSGKKVIIQILLHLPQPTFFLATNIVEYFAEFFCHVAAVVASAVVAAAVVAAAVVVAAVAAAVVGGAVAFVVVVVAL